MLLIYLTTLEELPLVHKDLRIQLLSTHVYSVETIPPHLMTAQQGVYGAVPEHQRKFYQQHKLGPLIIELDHRSHHLPCCLRYQGLHHKHTLRT